MSKHTKNTSQTLHVCSQRSHLTCQFKIFVFVFTLDLNQQITDEDIRLQFDKVFPSIWGRFSTEEDLDNLIDDFKVLHKMPQIIDTFSQLCLFKFEKSLLGFFEPVLEMVRRYKLPMKCGLLDNNENM